MIRVEHVVWNEVTTGAIDARLCEELCRRAYTRPIRWETARITRRPGFHPGVTCIAIFAELADAPRA